MLFPTNIVEEKPLYELQIKVKLCPLNWDGKKKRGWIFCISLEELAEHICKSIFPPQFWNVTLLHCVIYLTWIYSNHSIFLLVIGSYMLHQHPINLSIVTLNYAFISTLYCSFSLSHTHTRTHTHTFSIISWILVSVYFAM